MIFRESESGPYNAFMTQFPAGLIPDAAILDAVSDPIFIKDADHRWLYVNEAFARALGRPKSELIGRTDADFLTPDIYRGYFEEDDRVMQTGVESHKEEDIHEGTHRVRRILTRKTRIECHGQRYVFGIIRDITDVYQHTRFSQLGEIAGNLCHELMTPLTVMDFHLKNFADRLEEGQIQNEETAQFLTNMEKAKDRLLGLIKSVCAFSVNRADMPMSLTSLSSIVEEAVELATPRIKQRGVTLTVNPVPLTKIMCRGPQVGQIIINLLHNAADAIASAPSPWVKLSFEVSPTHLEIVVVDSGLGIPPEIVSKLMTPFFTTKPSHSGTGLGLSLASKLATEHGGSLWYDDRNSNTCFRLRLPIPN